ncbi:sugar transferase [Spirilliplanes yamanashiensis]|uniref:Multidrug MFS transporter n=1 Tax=Spirilliplanes yamanashiensis TaxID=42233 RepID=A0A8J3YAE2_9ACTN|nr:sugar transferase [Spirilliplanes yamanashiensis]MDP9818185.1 lipopolysaccharide/colanic/teichoic acid biosynthesis glycosyltransferase [Spirilliplanes yamanashiensis]GIJ04996.1 multidrug MFS transporter [Spirilliplanes yamanashiensis]
MTRSLPAARDAGPAPRVAPGSPRLTRAIDVVVSGAALVALSPLLLVLAGAVRATSRGPALFRQVRMGYRGQPFVMLKFRSMTDGCDDAVHREYNLRELAGEDPRADGSGVFKPAADPRVTRIGRLLRVTSLDELPQLVNVFRGEMSLVGPRPALDWEVAQYAPHHHDRFLVKPGITGLWQVSGRNRLSMREALDLDVAYVRRRSLALDLRILARTVPVVLHWGLTR